MEAVSPGMLRRFADQFLIDGSRGRNDCGGVHQASEFPVAWPVTAVSTPRRHPWPPRVVTHPPGPTCGAERREPHRRCPRGARPTIKGLSLRGLDFFWMPRGESL